MTEPSEDKEFARYLGLIGIPFVIIATPICGFLLGYWLDGMFGTAPYLSYIFLGFGIAACVRELYKLIKEFGKNDDQSNH
ncbi:MAG: AtpZ/AtpI family protein [Parachlamydiaceae bacterium]|nr:AtpZ/AtpI family protein [Parachlamydiaceae bacterium]